MLFLLRSWILFCALMTAGGWALSSVGFLNRLGYAIVSAIAVATFCFAARSSGSRAPSFRALRRRFSQPLPMLFLVLALLSILGGFLYTPINIDGLSYRIPRILHWMGDQRWHWIHSADIRLNVVAAGFDWLSAPLLLFTKSERAITLINAISFFFLPGACFLLLNRIGVSKRVAAKWMWILPAGFCYFMQAGSVANDMYAAIFTLSAVGLALRARQTGSLADLWISFLALALASSAKQTNLPFALPWLIAAAPMLPKLRCSILVSGIVLLLAIACSIVPNSLLNILHGYPWQGFIPGRAGSPENPLVGIVGNLFWIPFHNLQPPIIPWASQWNELRATFLASSWGEPFRSLDLFGYLHRAASEQFSGLGCTVTLLVIISWFAAPRLGAAHRAWDVRRWVRVSVWLGFVAFLAKVGINQNPRYLAPWYPFLCASFLLQPSQLRLIQTRWWKGAAAFVLIFAIGLTILSRQRPLFPAATLLEAAQKSLGANSSLQKVFNSYAFAETVRTELDPFLKTIPADQKLLGYASRFAEKEPFFWRPYFERKVLRVLNSDSPQDLRNWGLDYVIVGPSALSTSHYPILVDEPPSPRSNITSIEEWLRAYDAQLVSQGEYRLAPEGPVEKLYLVRLRKWNN